VSGVLATALRPAVGGGVLRRPQMASLSIPSRRKQQSPLPSRSALRARDALVLEHLLLADAIASATARRLFPLVEREDLIQVAREALVRSAPRCRAGESAVPYLRRCISGALQHHLRDRVRLVRISRREHEKGTWPLGHTSLDAPAAGELSLLEQLVAPVAEPTLEASLTGRALEKLAGGATPGSPGHGPATHCPRGALAASRRGAAADQPDGGVAPIGAPGDSSGSEEGPRRPAPAAVAGGLRPPRDSCQARGKSLSSDTEN
jgi:DNA-directed RNA polymerase specialized sigma24 family protein